MTSKMKDIIKVFAVGLIVVAVAGCEEFEFINDAKIMMFFDICQIDNVDITIVIINKLAVNNTCI